jgi:K+-sensing histidine kinase KdpD
MTNLGLRLVDEVSDDLRTPITIIKGCIETVLANPDQLDASQRDELLRSALRGADHLVATVQALEARLEAADHQLLQRALDRAPITLDPSPSPPR